MGAWCGLAIRLQATTPTWRHPAVATRRVDGHEPPVDLCQPPCPTTPVMGDDNVYVSGAKLSRPLLLYRAGQYGDRRPDPRDPCPWGQSECQPQPDPFKGSGHQPLGESAQAHFRLTVSISTPLTRIHSYAGSWVCVQRPAGESPCLRMWRGGRLIVPTKKGSVGVPLRWL
jgi:hypothetical protein